ncbi:endonuclease NucS domain-containing protein [Christiangramia portivictoriae]|uniref:endonuclease NucS domain-containing protein n=1 Tax=Christiangramia portivictoriae TaxID=326069 RepID=UPI0003FF21F1|nr:endonuclease NucS domain-containing protein [Christiangramia portivictoriae]
MEQKLSERQIEDVFENYHSELIEPDLELISRQHIFSNGRRADLIFRDRSNRKLIVELKRNVVTRSDIGQLLEYFGIMNQEKPRIALIAPIIPKSIKKAFEHFGIEYLEFDLTKIQDLYSKIQSNGLSREFQKINYSEIISKPLSDKKLVDGNIAFKVTYVDNDWSDVCSPNNADYNFKNRTWCKVQKSFKNNCQSDYWKNNPPSLENGCPCYDSIAKKELLFYPGHNHGPKTNNEPRRMLSAKQGKLMVLTSKRPGQNESERFIFSIAEIAGFDIHGEESQYEVAIGDFEKSIDFKEEEAPLFWDYFKNPNAPKRKAWNTGLFRYMDDTMIYNLLQDVKKKFNLNKDHSDIIEHMIKRVE